MNLTSLCVIDAIKDIFCDVGSPDKIITDNARYFVSEEFTKFVMDWCIHHITSSLRYPQGNGMAEKAVGIVKELYAKCDDVKLGLLLMKTTPVSNQCHNFQAPASVVFGRQLKANLPIYHQFDTCTLDAETEGADSVNDIPSKYKVDQDVWVKADPHTKWMAGRISQTLPNQSYVIKLTDGHVFHRNEHHITKRQGCLNPSTDFQADPDSHSYNLRPWKNSKCVKWPDLPVEGSQGKDFELPSDF